MASNRYTRIIFIIATLLLVGLVLYLLSDIVAYILIAWIISMLGTPVVNFLQKHLKIGKLKVNRTICTVLTLLIFISVFAGIGFLFVPIIIEQASNLARVDTNAVVQALEEPINALVDKMQNIGLLEESVDPEQQVKDELTKWFQPSKLSDFLGSFISLASTLAIAIFSILFISFFFLKEQGLFTRLMTNFTPTRMEDKTTHALDEISNLLTRYFGGIVLQISIITIFLSILLTIINVKNALLIAFFAALINVIPYLGPLIGGAFGVMLTITSSLELDFYTEMLPLLLKVVLCFMSMQLLDNFILQPFIFSNRVRSHPLEIFIIIMIGAKLAGIVGMILAIPTYTVIRVIARTFLSEFEVIQKIAIGLKNHDPGPGAKKQ
jgi:predicted PurR-regulated permease PerM